MAGKATTEMKYFFQAHRHEGLSFHFLQFDFLRPMFFAIPEGSEFHSQVRNHQKQHAERVTSNVSGNQNFFICKLRTFNPRTNFSLVLLKFFLPPSETPWLVKSLSVIFSFSELFAKKIIIDYFIQIVHHHSGM